MNLLQSMIIGLSVFFLAQSPNAQPQDNVVNWNKAYEHAKKGQKVKLTLKEVTVDKNEGFDVYIKDFLKETYVGNVSAVNSPATVEMSMTKALSELRKPPSNKAKIYLKAKAQSISMGSFRIELLPEKD